MDPVKPRRLTIHDHGCRCWPHVSENDAVGSIVVLERWLGWADAEMRMTPDRACLVCGATADDGGHLDRCLVTLTRSALDADVHNQNDRGDGGAGADTN